jgi:serine/threonine protein kinase
MLEELFDSNLYLIEFASFFKLTHQKVNDFLYFRLYQNQQNCSSFVPAKYRHYKCLINKMTTKDYSNRPSCEEVINDDLFCVDQLEAEAIDESQAILKIEEKNETDSEGKEYNIRRKFIWRQKVAHFFLFITLILVSLILYYSIPQSKESYRDLTLKNECLQRTEFNSKRLINETIFCNGIYALNFIEIRKIGGGIHGSVYEAVDKLNNQNYAIKKIRIKNIQDLFRIEPQIPLINSFEFRENFVRYYRIWLEERNIDYVDSNENKFTLFVQMELCDKTLEETIHELDEKLKTQQNGILMSYFIKSELFLQILKSINYLHQNGIIDGNMKPSNVLMKKDHYSNSAKAKITDFGFWKIFDLNESKFIDKKIAKYRSQERLKNNNFDKMSDIFSLGVIAEEMFSFEFFE